MDFNDDAAWRLAEQNARTHIVERVLADMRFPAARRDVQRALVRGGAVARLPGALVDGLPDRRFESPGDVRATLRVLGAFEPPAAPTARLPASRAPAGVPPGPPDGVRSSG